MGKSEFEKSMLKAVSNHTHRYTVTVIGDGSEQGEIYLRCEDTCPIGSSITFPCNPRKHYGEQIAREIEASNVNVFMTTPETIRAHYAAIARGGK